MIRVAALALLILSTPVAAPAQVAQTPVPPQTPTPPQTSPDFGRVVVTISVEGLRVPVVRVQLRDVDGNMTISQTISDTVGQATIPDVPPGRYVILATREGFHDTESTPFTVVAGGTAQVLVETQLMLTHEVVDVMPSNSPTGSVQPVAVSDLLTGAKMDVEPLAGDDFQSLLTMLPSIIRGPDGRLRIKGGSPTTGALQVSSASLNDPSTGDFDLELPSGAVESIEVLVESLCRRVRPLFDQRHAGTHQTRHQRVGGQTDQSRPQLRHRVWFHRQVRAAAVDLRSDQEGQAAARAVPSVSIRAHQGQEPARRAAARPGQLRFVHTARRRALLSPRRHRRRHLLPAQDQKSDDVHVQARRDDPEVLAGGIRGRRGRSSDPVGQCRPRVDGRGAHVRGRSEHQGRGADGLRAAGAERQLLQQPATERQQPAARPSADRLERPVDRPACLQVRRGSAALALRRDQLQPSGRCRPTRWRARRAYAYSPPETFIRK